MLTRLGGRVSAWTHSSLAGCCGRGTCQGCLALQLGCAAAQYYFGKSAAQLAVEECALLAGLVQHPSGFNPYSPDPKARAAAKARRNHVLRRMAAEGYLTANDAKAYLERPVRLARERGPEPVIAPHVLEEVRKYLYAKYGRARVLEGGLEVTTTLDAVWQLGANQAVRAGLWIGAGVSERLP